MRTQRGTSMIEFTIAAVPVLFLGLGSIELARWMLARQAISLALLQGARVASTEHGHPQALEQAFEDALLPLFAGGSRASRKLAQQSAFAGRSQRSGLPPWQVQVLSPSPLAFHDHADPALRIAGAAGRAAINNNYQFEQDQGKRARGWVEGRGPASGQSVFEANTLVLRLQYLHEPIVPGFKGLLSALGNKNGAYGQRALASGYLPIMHEIALGMQSHPVNWALPASGKIVQGLPMLRAPDGSPGTPGPTTPQPGNPSTLLPPGPADLPVPGEGLVPDPGDPACGLTLCCL